MQCETLNHSTVFLTVKLFCAVFLCIVGFWLWEHTQQSSGAISGFVLLAVLRIYVMPEICDVRDLNWG